MQQTLQYSICEECLTHNALLRLFIIDEYNLIFNPDHLDNKNPKSTFNFRQQSCHVFSHHSRLVCDSCYKKKILAISFVKKAINPKPDKPKNQNILEIINFTEIQEKWEKVEKLYNKAKELFSKDILQFKFDDFIKSQKEIMKNKFMLELDAYLFKLDAVMGCEYSKAQKGVENLTQQMEVFFKDNLKIVQENIIDGHLIIKAFQQNMLKLKIIEKMQIIQELELIKKINLKPQSLMELKSKSCGVYLH